MRAIVSLEIMILIAPRTDVHRKIGQKIPNNFFCVLGRQACNHVTLMENLPRLIVVLIGRYKFSVQKREMLPANVWKNVGFWLVLASNCMKGGGR